MEINLEVLYIIIGIICFIYSVIKNFTKKPVTRQEEPSEAPEFEETAGESPQQRPHRRETVSKPFDERVGRPQAPSSFEELLREFEEADKAAETTHKGAAAEKVKKVQEVDDEFVPVYDTPDTKFSEREAERRIRETEARKALQEKASAVERAEAIDKELDRKIRTNTDSSLPQEVAPKKSKKAVLYQEENKRREKLLQMLKNPDNVTNTILASEILQRKYF